MEYVVVTTTTETASDAYRIAEALVGRKLAACVQVVGPIHSVYRWKGKVENSVEYRCEIKTRADHFGTIEQLINDIHPYELPELIVLPIARASPQYAAWLEEHLNGE